MPEFQKPPPLNIKCTSADCENELHCFKQLKKMTEEQRGKCRYCGADLVDWDRLHMRDFGDVAHTFAALKNEMIRHYFFHRELDDRAVRHAQRKGRIQSSRKPRGTGWASISRLRRPPGTVARPRSRGTPSTTLSMRRPRAAGRASTTGTTFRKAGN